MPVSLSVDDVSEDSVTLSWISPASSGLKPVVGYKIFRQAGGGGEWELCGHIHRCKQLSYTVTDLDFACAYRFRVCAVSEMGVGKAAETSKMHIKKPIRKLCAAPADLGGDLKILDEYVSVTLLLAYPQGGLKIRMVTPSSNKGSNWIKKNKSSKKIC